MNKKRAKFFGDYIRGLRKSKKIGVRELARMINVSPTFLSLVELHEAIPSSETMIDIAKALKVDSDYLLAIAEKVAPDVIEIIINSDGTYSEAIRFMKQEMDKRQ